MSTRQQPSPHDPHPAPSLTDVMALITPLRPTSLRALVRRHGHHTERQRANLLRSVLRHVIAGTVNLEDANEMLTRLGLHQLRGPGQVSFRLGVAMRVVHEDDETDAAMLRCQLDEAPRGWHVTRLAGVLNRVRVSPPRFAAATGRRHTVVSADLRSTVTVPAYMSEDHLAAVATVLLYDDLRLVAEFVDITDAPTLTGEPVDGATADAPNDEEHDEGEDQVEAGTAEAQPPRWAVTGGGVPSSTLPRRRR